MCRTCQDLRVTGPPETDRDLKVKPFSFLFISSPTRSDGQNPNRSIQTRTHWTDKACWTHNGRRGLSKQGDAGWSGTGATPGRNQDHEARESGCNTQSIPRRFIHCYINVNMWPNFSIEARPKLQSSFCINITKAYIFVMTLQKMHWLLQHLPFQASEKRCNI